MKVPVKGQMEEIRPVKFREEIMWGGWMEQNNAGNNEKPEKGSCLPFPLLRGAGRMLRVVLRGKRSWSKSTMQSFGLEKAFKITESRSSRAQLHIQLHAGTLSGFASFFILKFKALCWKRPKISQKCEGRDPRGRQMTQITQMTQMTTFSAMGIHKDLRFPSSSVSFKSPVTKLLTTKVTGEEMMPGDKVPMQTPAQEHKYHLPGPSDPSGSPQEWILLLKQGAQSSLQHQNNKNPNLISLFY